MSYENPDRRMYPFGTFDFGGGADGVFYITGKKGKGARLIDYGVFGSTEVFAGGTTTPMMSVGVSGNLDAYGEEFDLGTLATLSSKSVLSTYDEGTASGKTSIDAIIVDPTIPANTPIGVNCIAATGSGLTGMAVPFVVLDWDW